MNYKISIERQKISSPIFKTKIKAPLQSQFTQNQNQEPKSPRQPEPQLRGQRRPVRPVHGAAQLHERARGLPEDRRQPRRRDQRGAQPRRRRAYRQARRLRWPQQRGRRREGLEK